MTEQPDLKKEQREEREKEILTHCKQQQLRLQEFMSEEQTQLCKSFALEKKLGFTYRKEVGSLAQ